MDEADCRQLLRRLEEEYPIKDMEVGDITLLFAGWGMGLAMLKRNIIVIPKYWLNRPILAEFAIVHEYAHMYREKQNKKINRWRIGFHDKEMKRIETKFMNENGITLKRWLRYPREIRSERYGEYITPRDARPIDIALGAISWNANAAFATLFIAPPEQETALILLYFGLGLWFVNWMDGAVANLMQNIAWLRHWWAKRKETYDKNLVEILRWVKDHG